MIEASAWGVTTVLVFLASVLGYRVGARRILLSIWTALYGSAAGIMTVFVGLRAGWFWPFGLLTPVLLGLLGGLIVRRIARRRLEGISLRVGGAGRAGRAVGALLGAGGGVSAVSCLWLLAALANAAFTQPMSGAVADPGAGEAASAFEALLRTAHRGFVRHLPLVGSWGDEVEALTSILKSDAELRAQLAIDGGWERLAELSSLQAIIRDQATLQDIESVAEGEVLALYRLQRNPLILDFFAEPEVQKLLLETRPSTLASRLAALEARRGTTSSGRRGW